MAEPLDVTGSVANISSRKLLETAEIFAVEKQYVLHMLGVSL
jgi:hypothetical protein